MAIKMSRRGPFLACTAYPKCKNAQPIPEALKSQMPVPPPKKPAVVTEIMCDNCGKPMVIRSSSRGEFLGCSGFPRCRNAQPLPTGEIPLKKVDSDGEKTAAAAAKAAKRTPRKKVSETSVGLASSLSTSAVDKQDGRHNLTAEAKTERAPSPESDLGVCEKCGSPMVQRSGRFGPFIACSGYPKCKNIRKTPKAAKPKSDDEPRASGKKPFVPVQLAPPRSEIVVNTPTPARAEPAGEPSDEVCEKCGKPMVIREGRFGRFLACTGYPDCKTTKKLPVGTE
jgi:DNA topoisomerase-1